MNRRDTRPPRDFTEHRGDWARLAQRTLAALDDQDLEPGELRALGDLAALARNGWTFPAAPPVGNIAAPLAVGALAWSRLPSESLRAALAPGVRVFADAVLQLLTQLETFTPPPKKPAPPRRFRADIDG